MWSVLQNLCWLCSADHFITDFRMREKFGTLSIATSVQNIVGLDDLGQLAPMLRLKKGEKLKLACAHAQA